jgi:pyrroloquinoline quinone biosynthesis protein E
MRESSHRQQCVSAKAPEISGIRSDHQPGTEGSVRFAQSSLPVLKYLPSKDAPDSVLISTPDSDSLIEVSSPGGIRLLDALQGGLTLDAAVQSVAGTLALPQEAVRRASESLVTELRRTGILSSQAQPVTGRRVIASLGNAPKIFLDYIRETNLSFLPTPLGLRFQLTDRCPLRCRYCFQRTMREDGKKGRSDELTAAQIESIVKELAPSGLAYVEFSGGEPMMRDDLVRILSSVLHRHIPALLLTSGLGPSVNSVIEFLSSEPNKAYLLVQVSVDGHDGATHNATRRGASFAGIKEMIRRLVQLGILVHTNTVITRANVHALEDIAMFLGDMGVDAANFSMCTPIGLDQTNYHKLALSLREYVQIKSDILPRVNARLKRPVARALFLDHCFLRRREDDTRATAGCTFDKPAEDRSLCPAGILDCAVSPSGALMPCSLFGPIRSCHSGDVRLQPFLSLWQTAPSLQAVRHIRPGGRCLDCELSSACQKGCAAMKSSLGIPLSDPDPYCWYVPKHPESARDAPGTPHCL